MGLERGRRHALAHQPSSNEAIAGIDVCAAPEGVAVADGSVWVVCEDDGVVARIDPETDEMVDQVEVGLSRGS